MLDDKRQLPPIEIHNRIIAIASVHVIRKCGQQRQAANAVNGLSVPTDISDGSLPKRNPVTSTTSSAADPLGIPWPPSM